MSGNTAATTGEATTTRPSPADLATEALRLVGADAHAAEAIGALAVAAARVARDRSAESTAWRARGLAARDLGQLDDAEQHLRRAVTAGLIAGRDRAAEAQMTLAFVLLERGHLERARALARRAVAVLSGQEQARARVQLGLIEQRSGALNEALATYAVALTELRRGGDALWEARLLNNRGILRAYRGEAGAAERDLAKAESLLLGLGQAVLAADARWNLGFAAGLRGDAVTALECFESAGKRLDDAGIARASHALDQCQVLLSVGLVAEALAAIETGIAELTAHKVGIDLAEARLLLSETLLAAGDVGAAALEAREAVVALEKQGRPRLAMLARYAWLRATVRDQDVRGWRSAEATADALRSAGWVVAATDVVLLMFQRAAVSGQQVSPDLMATAAAAAKSGPAGQRLRAWHAVALGRLSAGDRLGAFRALLAGLAVHERDQATLAATELQVHTAARARGLAETGLRMAVVNGNARTVFSWSERGRAGSLLIRPRDRSPDVDLAARLTELRAVTAELEQSRLANRDVTPLHRRQHRLERAVAERARSVRGPNSQSSVVSLASVQMLLGDDALVEYLLLDRRLFAVVVTANRCSLQELGPFVDVISEMESLRFAMTRMARGGSGRVVSATAASLSGSAQRLDHLLLEPIAGAVQGRSVVVVPTGEMHVLPWGLLPSTEGRTVTVSPSASVWAVAAERRPLPRGDVVVVAGPGLPGAAQEVAAVADVYGDGALVLKAQDAHASAVTGALAGASYAHIAAHGHFRSDNPLFSSVQLADGPLTVYDLEAMASAPSVVVLSACDSGLSALHPGDELMGLVSAFLRLGTRSLVASVAPVPDMIACDTMVAFHRALRTGASPAAALLAARAGLDDEQQALAGSFVCFGAG